MTAKLLGRILGTPVRAIPSVSEKTIYLTFDDGPDPYSTPAVLKLLEARKVPATFFVVAEKARRSPGLISEIRAGSHAFGNHSLDHRYSPFFKGLRTMRDWIRRSEDELTEITGAATVGFRPPAGVRTPELASALRELEMPLILWNTRFYDTAFAWNARAAHNSARRITPGSIILLHDRQNARNLPMFLRTLDTYIDELRQGGFEFRPLSRKICFNAVRNSNKETAL